MNRMNKIVARSILACMVAGSGLNAKDITRQAELPGEQTAEQILNGEYPWPASPAVDTSKVADPGFNAKAFGNGAGARHSSAHSVLSRRSAPS